MAQRRWRIEHWFFGVVVFGQLAGCPELLGIAACQNCGKDDPVVDLSYTVTPADGATVTGEIPIVISVPSDSTLSSIAVSADGTLLDMWSPGRTTPIPAFPEGGSHQVRLDFAARDSAGADVGTETEMIDWHPIITISFLDCSSGTCGPIQGIPLTGTSTVRVVLAQDMALVQSVEFFVDDTSVGTDTTAPLEATFDTTPFTNGVHTLRAAIDLGGSYQLAPMATIVIQN